MVGAPARVYTSEVTQPHLRGTLSALASVSISFGVLLQYTLGSCLTWQVLSAVSAVIPLLTFVLMIFLPETPNYLVSKQKTEKARKSLAKLRGSTYNVDKEISQLVIHDEKNVIRNITVKEKLKVLFSASTLKPFGMLVTYFMMYQFSGVNTITFYAVEIFEESSSDIDKYAATIILGAVRFIFTFLACIAMRRVGRRPLTFISSIGCGITMIGLGTYMYYKEQWALTNTPPTLTWFPIACIFVFTVTCTLGFLVVPWVMIGEVYPAQVRGIVGGMTTCSAHLFVFIVVKTYPFLADNIHKYGAFWSYGCISLLGTIFFYFCLPETKGRTLQEIEDYFSGRTKTLQPAKQIKPDINTATTVLSVEKGQLLP